MATDNYATMTDEELLMAMRTPAPSDPLVNRAALILAELKRRGLLEFGIATLIPPVRGK